MCGRDKAALFHALKNHPIRGQHHTHRIDDVWVRFGSILLKNSSLRRPCLADSLVISKQEIG
jgi:hypothetical protein